ncbi:RrF2 family transcriptional regulator [Calderihabitans maritimus]|uniref:AsnC family transcriptional regulator n=1 Tax=Calderihabitans maritimus TaxID=1246530 RepID=A0A1Z5HQY2_9FIRM|nr:Rrf2 family transcriptional regulator [Calderihabitans maritimus]GAW91936.1 AsnC family transcriptional regulator [Calderihabitans maritimus]
MKLNQATDYAFRAVLYMSRLPMGEVVEAKEIAEQEKIPLRFLLKIFRQLVAAGLVRSYRGVKGGYALAKHPKDISLRDVVEAVEGSIVMNRCLIEPEGCNKGGQPYCSIHHALSSIQKILIEELSRYDFYTLAGNSGRPE